MYSLLRYYKKCVGDRKFGIRKVIIPASELGTKFLPQLKLCKCVDKPTIQYIVEAALASSIEDKIIVSEKGKFDLLNEIQSDDIFQSEIP